MPTSNGANGRQLVFVRNKTAEPFGLTVTVPGARLSLGELAPQTTHMYRMTFRDGLVDIHVDDRPDWRFNFRRIRAN